MRVNRLTTPTTSIKEKRNDEVMAAKVAQQEALIAYMAVMTDVELPTDEEESEGGIYE